uniref:Uncharacterized protein n=1 Tax=Megaselia scalaris TaxID=36166 RepID=T1GW81_MEGSC
MLVSLYGSESWALTIFERRILPITYRPVCEEAWFENFELDVCNGLDMCRGWKKMSWQGNVSLQNRMDIERKEDFEPDGVMSYHVMLGKLAFLTDEQQQQTVKYGRQLLIKRNLVEGPSSLTISWILKA